MKHNQGRPYYQSSLASGHPPPFQAGGTFEAETQAAGASGAHAAAGSNAHVAAGSGGVHLATGGGAG